MTTLPISRPAPIRPAAPSPEAMAAVLAAMASPTYRVITGLAYHTALRPAEIAGLYRCHLDLPRRRTTPGALTVLAPDTGHQLANRAIPLNPAHADQLRRWLHLVDPDPTAALFAPYLPGWTVALGRAARTTGHTPLTARHCRAAGIATWWRTGLTPAEISRRAGMNLAALLTIHPNPAHTAA